MRALILGALLGIAPACATWAELDPAITEALALIRDEEDGGALWSYLRLDPIPILFAALPPRTDSLYRHDGWGAREPGAGAAWILIDIRLRGAGPGKLSRLIYHEYIHRLQDKAPERISSAHLHTRAAYEAAMRYLGQQVRPGGPRPEAPEDIRAEFNASPHALSRRRGARGASAVSGGRSWPAD